MPALAHVLSGLSPNKKSKKREDDFTMRSAAQALGEIRSRAGVAPLIAALTNETNSLEVRRAAAEALGSIGDSSATSALEAALASHDPYLAEAARAALRRLRARQEMKRRRSFRKLRRQPWGHFYSLALGLFSATLTFAGSLLFSGLRYRETDASGPSRQRFLIIRRRRHVRNQRAARQLRKY